MKFLIWLVCVIGIEATGIISSLFYLYDPLCSHRQKSNVLVYSLFDLVSVRRLLNDWLNFIECLIEKTSSKRRVGRGFFLLDIVFSQFHKAGNIF